MRLHFSVFLAPALLLFASGSATAACDVAELKFLQSSGYSVAEAIKWCKGAAPGGAQAVSIPAAVPVIGDAAMPAKADRPNAAIPQVAAVPSDKAGTAEKPVESPNPAAPKTTQTTVPATPAAPPEDKGITPTASAFLKGWGVGLAYIKNRSPIVSDAVIMNGVVRATSIQNYQTELIFGSHWYFQGEGEAACGPHWIRNAGCLGIFLGVGVGGSNSASQLIDFVGAGLIWGFGDVIKADGKTIDAQTKKHSIGVGIGRRFNVKHLGEGFSPNQAPPAGETQIRYDVRDTLAPYLFYTYNF